MCGSGSQQPYTSEVSGPMRQRIRAAVIIVEQGKTLLVHEVYPTLAQEGWVPPGGGLEESDASILACAQREVLEETGLQVSVGRLLYFREFRDMPTHNHNLELFFLGHLCDCAGDAVPVASPAGSTPCDRTPCWLTREEMRELTVYPAELKDVFWEDREAGFPTVRYLGVCEG